VSPHGPWAELGTSGLATLDRPLQARPPDAGTRIVFLGVERTTAAIAIVTLLMVFVLQNTQNRDSAALHLKLDEMVGPNRMHEMKSGVWNPNRSPRSASSLAKTMTR
jgi:hypothetical protein